ncbi:MAG: dTMP kinase [Boseongicola sp. SB0673_bin_14]|nr:dTMP kinase [Pseudomonadota bacterium]MYI68040.1 dTMP kinase [Boseongicola sp. SB0673_bin_14]MYJ96696.1 dTMP kinase [Pseudomonadota bacterium]
MRGAFITLEGTEGVGKTTCLEFVLDTLSAADIPTVVTREPGGTVLGEKIRDWILRGNHGELSAETETLLMFAARAFHLDEVIRPALAAGRWVICDRFSDATVAYQGGGRRADKGWIKSLRSAVHAGLEPDLTLLLDAPVEIGLNRIRARAPDHFERENRDFFVRVRAAYLELARDEPHRIKVIDAAPSLTEVRSRISAHLATFLGSFAR